MKRLLSWVVILVIISCMSMGVVLSTVAESEGSGWHLIDYKFKDATSTRSDRLMGTTATMTNVIKYSGEKGNIQITYNRYDDSSGKLLHGITYGVIWSDPPNYIRAGEKISVNYEIRVLTTTGSWTKPPQNSANINQGMGVNFSTPEGVRYLSDNIRTVLTSEKAIEAGTKGKTRTIQMIFGNGYMAEYIYEWRDTGSTPAAPPAPAVAGEAGWYLINYKFRDVSATTPDRLMGTSATMTNVIKYKGEKGDVEITYNRYDDSTGKLLHGITYGVSWSDPPSYIRVGEKISINYEIRILSTTGSWTKPSQNSANINQGMGVNFSTPEGVRYLSDNIRTVLTSEKAIEAGTKGRTRTIQLVLGTGYMAEYIYEWRDAGSTGAVAQTPPISITAPATAPTPAAAAPTMTGTAAEAFASGSRIMWQPSAGLGYRLFRSESKSSLGISVTDFYITGTSYADVNVEPNTTYYYTVKPVLAEANPFNGTEEKLGSAIATFTVKTGDQAYKPGSYKHFIMLKLDSPSMSIDGISQEVDPGRGTAPLTITGRTMVPIRSVVEAMGGTVEWDGTSQKITLKARGNTVEMWMGKTDIRINGVAKKMDVAPASKNSRTFVPVRFAAENLNCKVDWINSTKEAIIVYEE